MTAVPQEYPDIVGAKPDGPPQFEPYIPAERKLREAEAYRARKVPLAAAQAARFTNQIAVGRSGGRSAHVLSGPVLVLAVTGVCGGFGNAGAGNGKHACLSS